jgi:parallel beta-helix repeat protein
MSINRRSFRFIGISIAILSLVTLGIAANWSSISPLSFLTANEATEVSPQGATAPAETMFVTATVCTGGTYPTLKSAFDDINSGILTGAVQLDVIGDCAEVPVVGAASMTLNASGTGSASYSSVLIQPSGGAARNIIGSSTAGFPMIDFNGADNVTINGLNAGGNSLTISNTTVSTTAQTGTIRFINDATSNTIQLATINGAATGATTGTIIFGTTTGTAGNDNNTVTACNIGPVGATFPANGILSNGTTTSQATRNSGLQITSNNIFDFFTNTAVIANGFLAAAGTTDATITGNNFYQTAPRTMTVAASGFIGISIADTSSINNNVSNNFIGGSTFSAGGTAWTQTGAVTHTFIGIRMSVGSTTPSSLQNNTITNLNISTSTTSTINAAISAATGAMNIGTVTGNTIGATSGTGSITWTAAAGNQFAGILAGTGTPNGMNISNNKIGSISVGGAGVTTLYGIRFQGTATAPYTVSNNVIGSTSTANSITSNANGAFVGIAGSQTVFPATVSNNTIQNLQHTSTGTSASLRGIELTGSVSGQTISGNTIRDFSSASTNTSANSGTAILGIFLSGGSTTGNSITTNTVRDLAITTSGAIAVTNQAIYIASTPVTTISRNLIFNLTTASTSSTSVINGINLFNSAAAITITNNMMRLGVGVGNNPIIRGILDNSASASPTNIYFNSIYIDGTQTANAVNTACISKVIASTMDVKDNILWNNRASTGAPGAGTGHHYGIQTTSGNPTSNFNDIYTPNNGGAIGFSTSDQVTLANWRTGTSQDLNSFNSDPQFIDAANASTPNLHIHPTNLTFIEGNGIAVSPPVDDFDGQTRSALTPVDIGADAGNFSGVDLTPPVIAYTVLGNTINTTSRVLTISVTDTVSGVPTAGIGLPVLYYRKGTSGGYTGAQCVFTAGSNYNCTFTYSSLGGVVPTDTIQYYVVAQDNAANVSVNPSAGAGGLTANAPAASTPPTTPNSYLIATPISGTKTVCASGCDYTTLTGATGIFKAINDNVATGNINIEIGGDLVVGEDGTNGLNTLAEEPVGSNFNVKMYPTGGARSISGSISGALIRMRGTSRFIIDGSVGGSGTDRSLTIANTSAASPTVVLIGSIGTTSITGDAVKNCVIINGANTATAIVVSDATTLGNPGLFSNITIQNNDIQRAFNGVFATAVATPQGGSNLVVTQNKLDTIGANAIRATGVFAGGINGATISQNTIGNFTATDAANDAGVVLGTGTINAIIENNSVSNLGMTSATANAPLAIIDQSGTVAPASGNIIRLNSVSNITTGDGTTGSGTVTVRGITVVANGTIVERNNVQGIINTNSNTFGANGIELNTGNNSIVRNNFVSNVTGNMAGGSGFSTGFGIFGVLVTGGTGHQIYNNSVNLYGLRPGAANAGLLTAAFGINSAASTGMDVRNNIFANNITGGTTSVANVSVYLPAGGTSGMNLTWNNNSYYWGTDAARAGAGQAGATPGTTFFPTFDPSVTTPATNLHSYTSTLATGGNNDNLSIGSTGAVPFATNNDLHIAAGAPEVNKGATIASVTNDIDGNIRPAGTAAEIGADELTDTVEPDTTIGSGPTNPTTSTSATFTFSATDAIAQQDAPSVVASFECALDTPTFTACTSPKSYSGLAVGSHTFQVRAIDTSGNVESTPASFTWTITGTTADLSITKTDNVTTVNPGSPVTYIITASNAGPTAVTGAFVLDAFPSGFTATWTCTGTAGTSCSATGSGDISDGVTLPVGGSVTYTINGNVPGAASGTFSNSASIQTPVGITDPNTADNSATDTDTVVAACTPPNVVYVNKAWVGTPIGTDPDTGGPATNFGCDSFATIQGGIDGVAAPGTVNVAGFATAYNEDVNVNKVGVNLLGAGPATTTISGPIGGAGTTVTISANNATIAGFTVTRDGNNTTDWNNPGLNSAGFAIQGLAITGATIRDNTITGNRTGIDINNSNGHTVRNNTIDFNRTGLIFRNQTDNMTVVENFIRDNWTVGILFLDASAGSNVPVQSAAHSTFSNNNLSGNWYGQIVDRQSGGSIPAPGTSNLKNFIGDWFGTTAPVVTTANSAEPGYAAQIPTAYGGTATNPGGQPDIAGPASANFKYQPMLQVGTDTNVETVVGRGTNGFQGVPNVITVSPVNQNGWIFADDNPGVGTGSGGFEPGPGTPPLGEGSAFLTVDSQGRHILGTVGRGGTRIDDLANLTYSTYQNNNVNTGVAPSLQFDMDYDLTDASSNFEGRLVFEPINSPVLGPILQNTWQTWAAQNGRWYGTRTTVTVNNVTVPQPCSQAATCTFADVLALFPNAGVRNNPGAVLLFKAGGPWAPGFDGNVDAFKINVNGAQVTYDFEPGPRFAIDDVTLNEGNAGTTAFTFTVTRSGPTDVVSTVAYATADGTAVAPTDYTAASGTLTFNIGDVTKTVTVLVNGDTTFEPTETFFVNLTAPTNASITDAQGLGTITADDAQPTLLNVTPVGLGSATPTDNDYTRINNAVQAIATGGTVSLTGTFDWTEANAAASWALGSDGVTATNDDYSVYVPANLNAVTFTSPTQGGATIQGPGDLAGFDLEGVLVFDGGDNQNWTISNINIFDFDLSIAFFSGVGGGDAFNNTHIVNNHIRIARDLNATVAPADTLQNIGIHFATGTNQVISGNTIDLAGDGVSNGANFSTEVGMQSNTTGGSAYDGLQITNNTINVLAAQSANPEAILGIWENGHAHTSNITVSGNQFLNAAGNNPALNLQRAFRVTSHSSAATTVSYLNNVINGANIGFQWITGSNFTGNQPVVVKRNTITNGGTGILVQSNGLANASFNRITGNTTGLNNAAGTVTAENNWWGCNGGPGTAGCNPVTGTVDFNPWIVLQVTASPSTINSGGTSTVTADMTHNSDGTALGNTPPDVVPDEPVAFSATNGTMAPPSGTITNGSKASTFTSTTQTSGTGCATVDNQLTCANITVIPVPVIQFSSPTYKDDENQTATITVTRTGDTTGIATVNYATSNGTATGGLAGSCGTSSVDFEQASGILSFASGDASKTFTVKLCSDLLNEIPDETVNLTLSNVTGATLGSPSSAVLNINDTASAFFNPGSIDLSLGSSAAPYPSLINVSGVAPASIGTIRVTLFDVWHGNPDNMDVLLVGPNGGKYVLVGDTGGPIGNDPTTPVTLTFSDRASGTLPDGGPWTTGQFLPTTCETPVLNFPAPAPAGPYNEPGCGARLLPKTMFGSFGLSNPNGVWSLYVRDDNGAPRPFGEAANTIIGSIGGGWGLEFIAPTASEVSLSGRVSAGERGITNATVSVTGNSLNSPIVVRTGRNGIYEVTGLRAGETYVVTVSSRRFTFVEPSRVITLNDNLTGVDFAGSSGTGMSDR